MTYGLLCTVEMISHNYICNEVISVALIMCVSLSLYISIFSEELMSSFECLSVDNTVWENQILKHQEKTTPSSIDILNAEQCLELDIEGVS